MENSNNTQMRETVLMGLLTETSLHAGTGQTLDVIDLPIQREAHTGYPCVYGSAVKGALRALAVEENKEKDDIKLLFGDDNKSGSEYAGSLLITDARLLLLPVRSLTSHFKWVTCPAILERLQRDCKRLGMPSFEQPPLKLPELDKAIVHKNTKNPQKLFLEEFCFQVDGNDLSIFIDVILKLMGEEFKDSLEKQLVVVSNDAFSQLVKYATPVNAHIAIDNDTKTVKSGALWYEETLPPDSLLYVGVVAKSLRKSDVMQKFKALFAQPYLQLGGNETVGMGWCKVNFYISNHEDKK